ncbi:HAD family hydrolase [Paenisporosarcina cavernae]|uniref:HAD family hydrolase n=1 Tax=Paenisporosarcina cavernae TaxID=2320858 RepID=A0A385YVQ1_9BACL|nr:HAD family hydrolase [Paenisporosarcina cavernae]AYC30551.1 HAD family hydrolase [Paenisporosarcina cavernae]
MDSIIFDLDGTLWDPINTVLAAWNKQILAYDASKSPLTRKDFEGIMGMQLHEFSGILFPDMEEKERATLINACCESEHAEIEKIGGNLYPNVEKVLKELSKKYPLFIVSNCNDGYIEAFYAYHKLDPYFQDFENPGRTGLSKGENIQLVMERNNLSAPIYIGDTDGDRRSAEFAGIPFVYAAYGFGKVDGYDMKIESVEELLTKIDYI